MSRAIRAGRFAGVEVVADPSVVVLGLFYGVAVFIHLMRVAPQVSSEGAGLLAFASGVAIVASVFVHEISHAVVAGRLGLNVRSVRLHLFGGYSVIDGLPTPRSEFLVSIVGPVASLVLGFVFWEAANFPGAGNPAGETLWALGVANVAIGAFNLLPGFPLDGGRIVRSVLSLGRGDRVRATRIVTWMGRGIGYLAIVAGLLFLARLQPMGLFWIAAGWLLASSAVVAGKREQLSVAFDGLTAQDAMQETPKAVSADATISHLLDSHSIAFRLEPVPVEVDGRIVGVIGQDQVDSVAPSRWPSMRVRKLMTRIGPSDVIEADAPLESLLLRPEDAPTRVVVVRDGVAVGIVETGRRVDG